MQKGSVVVTYIARASPKNNHLLLHLCTEIIPFNKVNEGHSHKKTQHNGRKQYESLLFYTLWRKRGESSTVLSAQKGPNSRLLPVSALLQPPALRQRLSLLSTALWTTSVSGTEAGQQDL